MVTVLGYIALGTFGVVAAIVEGDAPPEPKRLIKKSKKRRKKQLGNQSRPPILPNSQYRR